MQGKQKINVRIKDMAKDRVLMIYFLYSKKLCMLHDLFIYLLVLGGFLHVGITYDTGVYIRVST